MDEPLLVRHAVNDFFDARLRHFLSVSDAELARPLWEHSPADRKAILSARARRLVMASEEALTTNVQPTLARADEEATADVD